MLHGGFWKSAVRALQQEGGSSKNHFLALHNSRTSPPPQPCLHFLTSSPGTKSQPARPPVHKSEMGSTVKLFCTDFRNKSETTAAV